MTATNAEINTTVYRYTSEKGEHLSEERASCERCGVEGWRGDYPDQGGIVHSEDGDLLCDDCAAVEDETTYTARIFDGNPAHSGPCDWPEEPDVSEASSPEEALAQALEWAIEQAAVCGEYQPGDRLWAIVWDDALNVAEGSEEVVRG